MHADLNVAAAQLALLAARASVSLTLPIRDPALRIASSDERLDPTDLAKRLAAMEKPLQCTAREVGGSIEITYSPLAPGTPVADWHAMDIRFIEEHGGYARFFGKATIDADNTMVLCFGRNESILLPVSAVELWHRQYYVAEVEWWGDRVDNPRCSDWPQFIEAKRQGALRVLNFSSPSDQPVQK
jgi:hypothetical protein